MKYRRICDGFVMDIKTGIIEHESNIQYVPYANPIISADPITIGQFLAPYATSLGFTSISGLATFATGLSFLLKNLAGAILAGALSGGGSGESGQARDEGVKTRVSPDTGNRLPLLYGELRMKGTVFMSELSTDREHWAILVAIAEGEVDSTTSVSWGDKVLTFDGDVNTGLRSVTNASTTAVDGTPGDDDDSYNEGRLKMRFYPQGGRCTEMEAFNGSPTDLPDFGNGLIGGTSNISITLNSKTGGVSDNGEVRIQGTHFNHPQGGIIELDPTDATVSSSYGEGDSGTYYIMYTGVSSDDRFTTLTIPTDDTKQFVNVRPKDTIDLANPSHTWEAFGDNTTTVEAFEPLNSDVLIAKITAASTTGGLTDLTSYEDFYGDNAWTRDGLASHRRCPFAYWYVELAYDQDKGVTSLGNINMEIKGRRVRQINSDGSLSTNKAYSTNPAECLVDYLTEEISGGRLPDSRLDLDSFLVLKNFCDDLVDYEDLNGGTRQAKRYTCNGVINTNSAIDENIQKMLIGCQAALSYTLGQFKVIINTNKASTHSFTDDNVIGTVEVNDSGFDTLNNEVIMHFDSKANNWQEDQVDAVSPASVRNANEPDLSVEIGLPFTNNSIEAQRLAHIDLNQWRQNIVVKFNTFISALSVQAGDVITLTHTTTGFTNKKFRVLQTQETASNSSDPLGIEITALEYDETVYTINAPHEVDNALNTNLPDPTVGVTISNIQDVDASTRDATTGAITGGRKITWDCSVPVFVLEYEIDYKLQSESEFTHTSFSSSEAVTLTNLNLNTTYDVRVRALLSTGSRSDYATSTFTTGSAPVLISPTALNISEENVVITEATGAQVRVTAAWSKPNVTFPVRYVLEYKLSSASAYTDSISVDETIAHILPFETGVYDFRVKAIDVNEVSSGFTTVTDKSIVGLTDIPADVTNFSIAATSTQALLSWTLASDVDVRTGGHVEIRYHSSTTSSANWAGAQSLVSNVPGSATSVSVPLLKGTYLVKFIDSGNRESLNASIVTNSFVSSNFAFVTSLIEDPTYLGTKNNCTVTSGELVLDSGETIMVYNFNNLVDLGTVRSIKVDPDLEVDVQAIGNQVCNISNICSELTFCGVQEAASVQLEMSTTDDDTTGTPTWSQWKSLIPGEYTARGFRFRLGVRVFDANTAAKVQKLRVEFDAENITQRGSVTTTTTDTTVTFPSAFYSGTAGTTKPNIGTQIIGGSAGDEVVIVSISNTGFVLGTYNNGTRVSRTVNWQAVGE